MSTSPSAHRPRRFCPLLAACLLLLACLPAAFAQDVAAQESADTENAPSGDLLGRDSPLGSITGFVEAAEQFDWSRASRFLDLRNLLEDQPDYRDELGRVMTRDGPVSLLPQRVSSRDGAFIWKVSNATVGRIPDLHEEFSYPDWVERIRAAVPQDRAWLGLELYKWVIITGFLLLITPLVMGIAYLAARLISSPSSPVWKEVRRLLLAPVTGLVVITLTTELVHELGVGVTAYRILESRTLATFFTVWFIWAAVDIWRARRRSRYEQQGRADAAVLGRPIANAIKLVTLLLGLLVWLANAGIDVPALLTGLGIGGIAVALALQKPIEDLFGAVSIYSQQPVSTGDLCRYGDSVGRVEEIGLRTTRIRTLSNSLVNVPNAQLSTGIIENLTARTKIMYQPDLPLRYDTSRQ